MIQANSKKGGNLEYKNNKKWEILGQLRFFFCLHFLLELLLPLKIVTKYFKLSNVLLSALSGCSFSPCLCEEKQGWMVWEGACLSNSPVSSADTLAAIKLPTCFSTKPCFHRAIQAIPGQAPHCPAVTKLTSKKEKRDADSWHCGSFMGKGKIRDLGVL